MGRQVLRTRRFWMLVGAIVVVVALGLLGHRWAGELAHGPRVVIRTIAYFAVGMAVVVALLAGAVLAAKDPAPPPRWGSSFSAIPTALAIRRAGTIDTRLLEAREIIFGSGSMCEVQLAGLNAQHAVLQRHHRNSARIESRGAISINGTPVARKQPHELHDDDVIRLGDIEITIGIGWDRDPDPRVGTKLAGRRVCSVLGKQPRGTLYASHAASLTRLAQPLDDTQLAQLRARVAAASAVCEAIHRIDDAGRDGDGIVTLVHPAIDRPAWLHDRRAPVEASEPILRLCRALAPLHAAGLAHLDLVGAHIFENRSGFVVTGLGMPPVDGEPELHGDVRSDVFALGTLLVAHLPTEVSGSDLDRELREEYRFAEWRALAERARDADPTRRFASAGELADAISELGARTPLWYAHDDKTLCACPQCTARTFTEYDREQTMMDGIGAEGRRVGGSTTKYRGRCATCRHTTVRFEHESY